MVAFYNTYDLKTNLMFTVNGISNPVVVYMGAMMLAVTGLYSQVSLLI